MDEQDIKKIWEETIEKSPSDKPRDTYKGKAHPYFAEKNLSFNIPVFKVKRQENGSSYPYSRKTIQDPNVRDTKEEILQTLADPSSVKSPITNNHRRESDLDTLDLKEILADRDEKIEHDYKENVPPAFSSYEVQGEIARGGMGVVYNAKQNSLKRNVAIKQILPKSWTPSIQEKFIAEATVTAYLNHPNIPAVYDLGQGEDGDVLMAMQLVEGLSWVYLLYPETFKHQLIAEKYSQEDHLDILLHICSAVAFAHNKGVIHNDLKPENIMVGEFREVYIMDWGIAVDFWDNRPDDLPIVRKDMIKRPMGTPSYMPPELATGDGQKIGPWTDIYLLGGLLYEIIERRPPRTGETTLDVLDYAVEGKTPQFSTNSSPELKSICLKALQKNIGDRYQNVHEFQNDIQNYLRHRQSLIIANNSNRILNNCLTNVKNQSRDEEDNIRCYDNLAKSVAGFEQALLLWKNNEKAIKGKQKARIEYAEIALRNGDFLLAEAQLMELDNSTKEVQNLNIQIQEAKRKRSRAQKITKRLRWAITIAIVVIICGLLTVLLSIQEKQQKMALQYASLYTSSLTEFRSAYSSKIVNKVKKLGVKVTHDYHNKENQIPFPATFSIELAEQISKNKNGIKARLYSNFPFPWRKDGGAHDDFQKTALEKADENSSEPYYRIEKYNGVPALRYGKAVIMKRSCVNCHNTDKYSPKKDWKVGDVRGIQEVVIPLGSTISEVKKLAFRIFLPITILALLMIFVIGVIVARKYPTT
ncbi:protein kinase [Candidatus Uabimicrobium sp. HlEnr_7]|uniref:protein kinase domain-containing protein n=1 Tax=Candidatus Uabimicrobium helgolandensis TaxID=3095367 RepID=UPI003558D2EA